MNSALWIYEIITALPIKLILNDLMYTLCTIDRNKCCATLSENSTIALPISTPNLKLVLAYTCSYHGISITYNIRKFIVFNRDINRDRRRLN